MQNKLIKFLARYSVRMLFFSFLLTTQRLLSQTNLKEKNMDNLKVATNSTVTVRYIVNDVDACISFYTDLLGFEVVMHPAAEFAMLSKGNLRLLLSKVSGKGGGGQAMPDGAIPIPGGWNRFELEVDDLEATVAELKTKHAQFRNDIVIGIGGKQILLKDPSGNLVELFQSTR
jgi:catechol 2,3-dioxygenase-like lactoylglutathione lyase family enzyme